MRELVLCAKVLNIINISCREDSYNLQGRAGLRMPEGAGPLFSGNVVTIVFLRFCLRYVLLDSVALSEWETSFNITKRSMANKYKCIC